ncbi:MAG: flagellar hook-basal body complex protein FliE, partial [Desulfofustis sp.]|nr:flagellar hook-basal body complex protein FliE [Desulfofustis sp.]
IGPMQPGSPPLPINRIDAQEIAATHESFANYIKQSIDQVNQSLSSGDKSIEMLHSGQAQSLHEVMIAVEEADISLRMFVQIRNKALQAYEEIMRMQI